MDRLVQSLSRLPGIGKRSAQRVAFYLLKQPPQEAQVLAQAILDLKHNVRHCSICFNLAEMDPCSICGDVRRDHGLVLVVEQPNDVATIEATGLYRGVYHVLMGRLSPLDGVGPGELNIQPLIHRIQACSDNTASTADNTSVEALRSPAVREVIIGTNPTLEGDGTSLYLADRLAQLGVTVTRLARGLPTGSSLEMVSKAVLSDAIYGRHSVK